MDYAAIVLTARALVPEVRANVRVLAALGRRFPAFLEGLEALAARPPFEPTRDPTVLVCFTDTLGTPPCSVSYETSYAESLVHRVVDIFLKEDGERHPSSWEVSVRAREPKPAHWFGPVPAPLDVCESNLGSTLLRLVREELATLDPLPDDEFLAAYDAKLLAKYRLIKEEIMRDLYSCAGMAI